MRISDWSSDVCSSDLILRQAFLGNIKFGHHLDARDQARSQLTRRRHHLAQPTVDAKADLQPRFETLDVNVRRVLAARLHQQTVYVLDDRRVVIRFPQSGRATCRERVCQSVYMSVDDLSIQKTR